ncbi:MULTISPECIES: TetR/AcrR family transcriptional regulator [Nocardia]|uniref:TetR/AcrR family transcriptional regulator n=1 Tax=Nocardia TaxID=1817 RepID=UPI0002DA1AA0|nr:MULTISPECIES: TetR/AcrR family transcriptional regulator [Nocardia]
MRYASEHKAATRRRIVEAAGRRFKRDGLDGSGVATLMKDAGLTNGAFYAHFESKEDLIANAVAAQLDEQRAAVDAEVRDRDGLERFVRSYLSPAHRDTPEDGCPSAALLDEIGRCADRTKQAYTTGMLAIADDIAVLLAPHDPASVRVQVLSVFAMMVGALQLSRALSDRQLADEVLERAVRDVLAIVNADRRHN